MTEAIKKSSTLCLLNKDQKESILHAITERTLKAGDIVIRQGTLGFSKMLFIISGNFNTLKILIYFVIKVQLLEIIILQEVQEENLNMRMILSQAVI